VALPRVRLAELLGAISLATDLGTGQPAEHGLRTAVLAVAVGRELGLDDRELAEVEQVALLRFLGCTSNSAQTAEDVGGDEIAFLAAMAPVLMGSKAEAGRRFVSTVGVELPPHRRAMRVAASLADPNGAKRSLSEHCEVATLLATHLGLGNPVRDALAHAYERWDGAGFPDGLSGEAVPRLVRIAVVARDADLLWRANRSSAESVLRARRGRAYAPDVVDAVLGVGFDVLAELDHGDAWHALLAGDAGAAPVTGDAPYEVVGYFVDLKSRWTRGHSARVAGLAAAAAAAVGLDASTVDDIRRAGWLHDVGRVGVPSAIWDKAQPLTAVERERVRLHSYLTERTLACCPSLEGLGRLAASHHERLDGSGYHRGARDLGTAEQLLASADVVAAMGEDRPHRPALTPAAVAAEIAAQVRDGRLDRLAAESVMAVAGHQSVRTRTSWPAGLSDREVEVLRHIARGRTNRETAQALTVSVKTIARHIENLYAKIGVNSRGAAAVFAMEHRLLER